MFNSLVKKLSGQDPDSEKPKQVATGVMLLYIGFILSMITDWLDGIGVIPFLVVFIVISAVITAISAGKKWARILMILFFLFNLLSFAFTLAQIVTQGVKEKLTILVIVLYAIEITIEMVALRLLFSKAANVWFNERREITREN